MVAVGMAVSEVSVGTVVEGPFTVMAASLSVATEEMPEPLMDGEAVERLAPLKEWGYQQRFGGSAAEALGETTPNTTDESHYWHPFARNI